MKIAINKCFGGFELSPLAIQALAKKKGKDCYFFNHDLKSGKLVPTTIDDSENSILFLAYSVPNPDDYRLDERDENGLYKEANERAAQICLDSRLEDRADKDLIAVIEELGEKASGRCAQIEIVEIPDGVDYIIEEYDGNEHIAEKHRTWY